jgi:hypothetical protein
MAIVRYCRRRCCESEKWRVNALCVYATYKLQRSPGRATDRKSDIIMARLERRRRQHPHADHRRLHSGAWRANIN